MTRRADGHYRGVERGTWIDRVVMGFSVLGFSFPVFVSRTC